MMHAGGPDRVALVHTAIDVSTEELKTWNVWRQHAALPINVCQQWHNDMKPLALFLLLYDKH